MGAKEIFRNIIKRYKSNGKIKRKKKEELKEGEKKRGSEGGTLWRYDEREKPDREREIIRVGGSEVIKKK